MQKKLKWWQIALLIIFYPAGIIYLIVKYCRKKQKSNTSPNNTTTPQVHINYTFVDTSRKENKSADCPQNAICKFQCLDTKKSIKQFRISDSYIVLDLETSGLSKYKNEIIEIAMVKIQSGEKIDTYQSLVKPSQSITSKIEKLTGITKEMLSSAPEFSSIADDVVSFIGENVLIAHNAKFDMGFLTTALEPRKVELKCIDTLPLARKALPELENHKLETLISYYGIAESQMHRAMDDVERTQAIFVKLCDEILSHVNKRSTSEAVK